MDRPLSLDLTTRFHAVRRDLVSFSRSYPLTAGFIAVLLFSLFSMVVIDRPVALWFKANMGGNIQGFFKIVTEVGLAEYWLVPSALLWVFFRLRAMMALMLPAREILLYRARLCAYFFLTMALSGIFVNLVKLIVGRWRPRFLFHDELYGFSMFTLAANSYPSGHSQAIWAAMTALMVICPRYNLAWAFLAVLVAVSRFATTVHFVSDVAMGSFIGIAGAILMRRWFEARGYLQHPYPAQAGLCLTCPARRAAE
ncbi:phosphatase PAP2 family protein [Telmatospirillum sp. J64-1]|uniref:phosphatase PAP2 family protein n=1 Tax=Telmatospirillum sp. J64-1 TaxID=2502183 RepID=UPI00115E6D19|nr:phosphatase PAP2 family protein [Telmatospirillum sp. J64-1]